MYIILALCITYKTSNNFKKSENRLNLLTLFEAGMMELIAIWLYENT